MNMKKPKKTSLPMPKTMKTKIPSALKMPMASKPKPRFRKSGWDTKSKWESDDLGSGYK